MLHKRHKILTFKVDDIHFALYLMNVGRVIRAVSITTVPKAAPSLYGLFDFHGEHIPVVNIRERFGRPQKPIKASDRFIITAWKRRKLAIAVDEVEDIIDTTDKNIHRIDVSRTHGLDGTPNNIGLEVIDTISTERGIIIIYDLEKLLGTDTIIAVEELFSLIEKENTDG